MTSPPENLELREVIAVPPGQYRLNLTDYPWLVAVRVCLKGGDAGTEQQPGEDGYCLLELYGPPPRT